jgi:hypothetical protein
MSCSRKSVKACRMSRQFCRGADLFDNRALESFANLPWVQEHLPAGRAGRKVKTVTTRVFIKIIKA